MLSSSLAIDDQSKTEDLGNDGTKDTQDVYDDILSFLLKLFRENKITRIRANESAVVMRAR